MKKVLMGLFLVLCVLGAICDVLAARAIQALRNTLEG